MKYFFLLLVDVSRYPNFSEAKKNIINWLFFAATLRFLVHSAEEMQKKFLDVDTHFSPKQQVSILSSRFDWITLYY